MDTGSSVSASQYLWIPSSSCSSCPNGQNKFKASASSTLSESDKPVELNYGSGSCSGTLDYDTVMTGQNTTVKATQQGFVLVDTEDSVFQQQDTDGILGLGFSSLSDDVQTFVQNLADQGQIDSALFSIYLSNDHFETSTDYKSNIIFGGYDVEAYADKGDDDIKYIDVIAGYWQVKLKKVEFDGDNIDSDANYAILDTGTSLLVAPSSDYSYIVKQLSEDYTAYVIDDSLAFSCSSTNDMPNIEFILGKYEFKLPASSIFLYQESLCYLLIEASDVSFWILGDVFLRNYYVIYDMDNEQVGLVGSITKDSDSDSSSDIPTWVIAVIVVCAVSALIIAAAAGGIIYIRKRRRNAGGQPLMVAHN